MPLMDHHSTSDSVEKKPDDRQSLKIPGLVAELSPVKQLDFWENSSQLSAEDMVPQLDFPAQSSIGASDRGPVTGSVQSIPEPLMSSGTSLLPDIILPPAVTRQLAETGALMPVGRSHTTTMRQPVIIRGSGKKSSGMLPPPRPKSNRMIVHLGVASLLVFVVLGALLVVAPVGHGQSGFSLFNSRSNAVTTTGNNSSTITQEQATAAAVMQDGHDVGTNSGQFALIPAAPNGANNGSLGRFFYGQCTYWANYRYHQLTGNWVNWIGDAWAWHSGAAAAGWNVSPQPHVPSIVVLQPYVQGAGGYGHVAVVEKINSNGSVITSDWNWYPALGASTSSVNFTPGPGVSFVWR